jgi:L-xylulose reductase
MMQMAWSDESKSKPMLARIPQGKFAQEIDVARAVAYLLSDKSDMINGSFLSVDGGFLAC